MNSMLHHIISDAAHHRRRVRGSIQTIRSSSTDGGPSMSSIAWTPWSRSFRRPLATAWMKVAADIAVNSNACRTGRNAGRPPVPVPG